MVNAFIWILYGKCPILGDIPRAPSYGIYVSQLIRFARVSSHVADFNIRNEI